MMTSPTQQTQNICRPITLVQCWNNVRDVGPELHKCYTNVLCLLGNHIGPALAVMGDLDKFVVSEPLRFATRIGFGERGAWGH